MDYDRYEIMDRVLKVLLRLSVIWVLLACIGAIPYSEIGQIIVGIICLLNYLKGSFESEAKRMFLSLGILFGMLTLYWIYTWTGFNIIEIIIDKIIY